MAPEPLLSLAALSKVFAGGVVGLDAIDLDIAAGEFLTLLGPSGCGKTTTLRVIAGFEEPTGGTVTLAGRDITRLRPFDRPVNTVFQDYALFPHMDVAENVGFGLSLRRIPAPDRRRRIAEMLDLVGLGDKIGARVQQLSGGQRQRVALARAIVCEPRILLLDEPLSALDAHLREQMQVELKRLQTSLGMTFVMVTHDQTEALSISDRIVVMNKGRIEQTASPAELYDRPATRFVANFIGTMNLLEAVLIARSDGRARYGAGALAIEAPDGAASGDVGGRRTLGVRPEDLAIVPAGEVDAAPATVDSVVFHGRTLRVHASMGEGTKIVIDRPRQALEAEPKRGDAVAVKMRPGAGAVVLER